MSQVYTGEEIVRNRVPKIKSFKKVINEFRGSLKGLYSHYREVFPAATIFGGCANGRFNVCSDIDIMVLINDTGIKKQEVLAIAKGYSNIWVPLQMAANRFVKVALYPVFMSSLQAGEKIYDKQFLSHVVNAAQSGGILCGKKDAFDHFRSLAPDNTVFATLGYIERKKRKLEISAFCDGGLSQFEVALMYLDAYQSPFHALRRVFDLWGTAYEDSKLGLITALKPFKEIRLESILTDLYTQWGKYVTYVEGAHFHAGIETSPLLTSDVQKSIFALSILRVLAQKGGG